MEDFEKEFKIDTLRGMDEGIQSMDELLSARNPKAMQAQDINSLFRWVHTLKGNAKAAEFNQMSSAIHAFEDVLIKVRDGVEAYNSNIHQLALDFCDRLSTEVESTIKDLDHSPDFDDLLERIQLVFDLQESQILVIDDDESMDLYLKAIISTELELNVDTANDGAKGLHMAKSHSYDVIISDYHMPGLDGKSLIELIRNSENPNQNTPIIFLSVDLPGADDNRKTWENVFFVAKPVEKKSLLYYVRIGLKLSH